MKEQLQNTAVKPNNDIEEKAIIALVESNELYVHGELFKGERHLCIHDGSFALGSDLKAITLDQLAWDYGLNPEWDNELRVTASKDCYFTYGNNKWIGVNLNECSDFADDSEIDRAEIISTRPQPKLKNGDYLPVSEVKTEQDYNLAVQSARNCGFDIYQFDYDNFVGWHGMVISKNNGLINCGCHSEKIKNRLPLTQWLERGCVKREEVKEWTPEVGEECLFRESDIASNVFREWSKCTILAYNKSNGGMQTILRDCNGDAAIIYEINKPEFKPLPTPEEIEREEFYNNLKSIWDDKSYGNSAEDFFYRLYDLGYKEPK